MAGFVPLGDASRRSQAFPVVTTLIVALNAYVFFKELVYGDRFVFYWSTIPVYIVHGQRWYTLVTSMFMHGGWMHIIGNMVYLWAFGREIEDAMGGFRFAVFYLFGGIVAMLAQIMGDPLSRVPSLGASGAIAAVMGAFLVTYPRDRIKAVVFIFIFFRVTLIPAALLIGFWFLIQVFHVGVVTNARMGGVAYLAHVGGFLFGVVMARLFEDPRRIAARREWYANWQR
ncbi:rhomboid family intramembrane serine protease [Acidobacteria bacterium AB60]|nr:rhomboid family intramembrane serine protease [Acidobacteria bacterium AB60]